LKKTKEEHSTGVLLTDMRRESEQKGRKKTEDPSWNWIRLSSIDILFYSSLIQIGFVQWK